MARASYSPYRSASGCWRTGNTEATVGGFTFFEQPISTNVLFRLRIHRVTFLRGDFVVKKFFSLLCFAMSALSLSVAHGQFSLQALSSFGGGDGWLAPGESGFSGATDATIRGIAYHSPSNRLIVVDRSGGVNVRLLSGDTGSQVGTLISAGVTGGTFAANMVGVADDGHVYMGNLSTSAASNFKVYRWDSSEVSNPVNAPTLAFDGLSNRSRTGDSFAVTGSGTSTQFVAAGAGATSATDSVFALFSTANGSNFTVSNPVVTGVPAGGMRLGIDFDGAGNVIGKQTTTAAYSAPSAGGQATQFSVLDPSETVLAFYAPLSLLATVQFGPAPLANGNLAVGNPGDVGVINTVRLYNASDLSNLVLLDAKNLTNIAVSNGNGVGALSFGLGPDGGLRLYALNANNGIQAFSVVPEPSAGLLALVAGLGLAVRRRRA